MAIKDYITVKNVIFFIVAVLFVKFISKISGIAMMFFASYVLACSLSPLVEILSKKIKRPMAATVVMSGMFGIFIAFYW